MAQITWTVLPNGLNNQQLKFSIFVSLRLEANDLADGFNWASLVASLPSQIDVEFSNDDGSNTSSAKLNLDRSLLEPTLWNSVFPTTAPVTPRAPINLGLRPPITFPIKAIRERIQTVYKDTAQRFGIHPPTGFNFSEHEDRESELYDFIVDIGDEFRCREREPPPPDPNVVRFAPDAYDTCEAGHPSISQLSTTGPFYQAYRFYRRSKNNQPTPVDQVNGWPKPQVPTIDVHQAMGALGDHPQLLRRLGLVVDGTVAPGQAPDVGRVRVVSDGDVTPWTHYTKDGDLLVATPNPDATINTDLNLGLLKLGDVDTRFDFHQLDIDGAALNLGNYAVNLLQTIDPAENDPTADFPQVDAEVPNLRTVGFVVAKNERATTLKARLSRSNAFEGQTTPDLFADDVTRGYRLDVRNTNDGVWHSLAQRRGWFLVGESGQRVPASGEIHDEGFIKGAAASSDPVNDGDPLVTTSKPIYIHEILFSWNGWSPVIKPPGREMFHDRDVNPQTGNPEVVKQVENTPETDFKVQPVFKVEPGTLPRLRFGQSYQMRARAVDLAGNSLPLAVDVPDESAVVTPAQPFLRYEPIPAPVLVLRRKVVEGESVEHIVIRSGSASHANNLFFSQNDRHVAPPTTTLDLVLMHGMLDALFNDPTKSFNIAQKSEGTFLDQQIFDTKTGNKKNVPGIQVLNSDGTPGTFPAQRGDGLAAGQYVIHTNQKLLLPYLPDPLAIGMALADGRPEVEQNPADIPTLNYAGQWPNPEPFKIVVQATGDAEPSVQVSGGNFVVRLPPATILPLNFSSLISEAELTTKMAIWQLIDPNEVEDFGSFETAALHGQHWMITPRRELVAVHAVDRPLRAAKFTKLIVKPDRLVGETFVKLEATIDNHAHSTGQIDIESSWTDQVDLLTQPGPTEESHSGRVHSVRPGYDDETFDVPPNESVDTEERPKQDFGDTKHRFVSYRPDGTTRYREYFPASFTSVRENILLAGEEFEVNVPSSARPDEPEVLYVVPTFRWDTQITPTGNGNNGAPGSATSKRIGRGLRVYLARPWFSSGEGELLGVVLSQDSTPTDAERRYVSEWGDDPVWRGNAWSGDATMSNIAIEDFVNPAFVSTSDFPDDRTPLAIAEDPDVQVQAVGFPVEYNADRQVWFADLEFGEISSQFPFVRLALARLQPDSIPGVELSRIVKAQFIQLVNDRIATLQLQSNSIRVSVRGIAAHNRIGDLIADALVPPMTPPTAPPGFQFDAEAGAGRIVTAHVESRGPGNSDDEWNQVGSLVTLPSFSPTSPTTEFEVLWTGNVPRPPRTPASFKHRLVIQEHEVFRTDSDPDVAQSLPIPALEGISARSRVIYLDVIPLDDIVK
jgi:hypothetical protein